MILPFYLVPGGARSAAATEEEFQMAFPWDFEETFELGTRGSFTAETDDLGQLDFPGPQDDLVVPPYRGGYAMRVDMNRSVVTTPTPAYVTGDTSLNVASGTTKYARIMMYLDDDVVCPAAADNVKFFQLISGASTEEAAIGIVRSDKGDLMIGIFSPDYNGWIRGIEVMRNEWFCLELTVVGHTTNAELRVHVGSSQVTAVGMAWATLTGFRLGSISRTVDVRGIMYFDSMVVDSDRLVAPQALDPRSLDDEVLTLTKTGYAFVGAGVVECLTLLPMTALDTVALYDTDRLPVAHHDLRMVAKAAAAETIETKGPKAFTRGCYAVLTNASGTPLTAAPTAIVQLGKVTEYGWGAMGEEGFAA